MGSITKFTQWLRYLLGMPHEGHWTLNRDGELEWEHDLRTPCSE